jgi:hypothetical protein
MSGRQPVVKIIAESLSQHDEKHVVPILLSGIRVGRSVLFSKIESHDMPYLIWDLVRDTLFSCIVDRCF